MFVLCQSFILFSPNRGLSPPVCLSFCISITQEGVDRPWPNLIETSGLEFEVGFDQKRFWTGGGHIRGVGGGLVQNV